MPKILFRITAGILAFLFLLPCALMEYLFVSPSNGLSPELQQFQTGLGLRSASGNPLVSVAQAEYEYYTEKGLSGGGRYWDAYGEYTGFRFSDNTSWCVCFVWYCAYQCGYLTPEGNSCFGSTWQIGCGPAWTYFEKLGCLTESTDYCPSPGDLIMFGKNPGNVYERDHIGIVAEVTDWGGVTVIEGNSSNLLKKNTYSSYRIGTYAFDSGGDSYIIGYLRPNYPAAGISSVEQQIFTFLTIDMRLPISAVCGILANIEKESNFDPSAVGDDDTSYGLCQWHNSRYTALVGYCMAHGLDHTTVRGQLEFLRYELESDHPEMLEKFYSAPNTAGAAYQCGYDWCAIFERPSNVEQQAAVRGTLARNAYWSRYGE